LAFKKMPKMYIFFNKKGKNVYFSKKLSKIFFFEIANGIFLN